MTLQLTLRKKTRFNRRTFDYNTHVLLFRYCGVFPKLHIIKTSPGNFFDEFVIPASRAYAFPGFLQKCIFTGLIRGTENVVITPMIEKDDVILKFISATCWTQKANNKIDRHSYSSAASFKAFFKRSKKTWASYKLRP